MINLTNEQIILDAMIMSKMQLPNVIDQVKAEDFSDQQHSKIFENIKELYVQKKEINLPALYKHLEDKKILGDLKDVIFNILRAWTGGLLQLNIDSLIDDSCRRQMSLVYKKANDALNDKNYAMEAICSRIEQRHKEIMTRNIPAVTYMSDMATNIIEDLSPSRRFNRTPFKELNSHIHGLFGGELTILAARPSIGKSAFAGNFACYLAEKIEDAHVLYFSLEMNKIQLRRRFVSQYARTNSVNIKSHKYDNEEQKSKVFIAMKKVDRLPIAIVDDRYKLDDIISIARKFVNNNQTSLLIIDYLQMIFHQIKGSNRDERVGDIAQQLKQLAGELNIPVLCIASLNRAVESRTDSRPQLSDLRESGAVEFHADNIWFLYRPKKDEFNSTILYCAKTRDGKAMFDVDLYFNKEFTLFEDV